MLGAGDAPPQRRHESRAVSSQSIAPTEESGGGTVVTDVLVRALHGLLPKQAQLRLHWDDPSLGQGACCHPFGVPAANARRQRWQHDGAWLQLEVAGAEPGASWWPVARQAFELALQQGRQNGRIQALEEARQLQQALYAIADLAGTELEISQMLACVHAVLDSLMYARNCFIVEYDDLRDSLRFLHFADELDDFAPDPQRHYDESELPGSLTFPLLRHGHPLSGPSETLQRALGMEIDPSRGPESLDWLGVPMLREGRVCGAIVVQSYDRAGRYGEAEQALLGFVAQHVRTAMDRRLAQVELERQVAHRTLELQRANDSLRGEVQERRRAERLQAALYGIAELSMQDGGLARFYARVHGIVGTLLDASNFYIALVNATGDGLEFVYSVDEYTSTRAPRPFSRGLTEYVVDQRRPLLANRADMDAMRDAGLVREFGARSHCWLGVPLLRDEDVVGAIVVQSYTPRVTFSLDDQRLLTFVAQNIGTGLARQDDQERLRLAHASLEKRVVERTRELADVNEKLLAQIAERLHAEQRLTHQAMHDVLTGLPNRLHLLDRLADAIAQAERGEIAPFAVLFLDLDRFKLVNDSIGHAAGDRLLVEVAKRIVAQIGPDDMVARLGGDEFAILLQCGQGLAGALGFSQRLLLQLQEPLWVAGRELFPSGSLGIALWSSRYRTGDELLRDADAAMYRAKAQGQDRCAIFDEHMREQAMVSLDMEADLRRAIINRDFVPYYQPIVRLSDGALVGHEALLRWNHEGRGVLLPGVFLALGEDSGLIEQVDWLIYEQVIARLARGGEGYVSVNVSPRHFREVDFVQRLFALVDAFDADPRRLRLEITEVALLDDGPRTLRVLQTLRERGIQVQLDDFGTGFSALSYLHRFPITTLKIDQSFIAGLHGGGEGQSTRALVQGVLSLARTLGIETIGEGIETDAQLTTLRELGCDYGQGYLFGRPAERVAALV